MLRIGEVFAGYVVERHLGSGGMGELYLARHPRLPRLIAIKLLRREFTADSEIRARFEREADLIARLDHPNIVSVYDRGVDDDRLWIAMQFVDGGDVSTLEPATLAPERAVHIVAETGRALDYAHAVGVVHRDVKPANIMLARPSPGHGERILLTDFGIGRLRDDTKHLTRTGSLTATLAYASPEQLSGAGLDHRSDQYSLACTLFWLLCGSTPFDSDNVAAVVAGHLHYPPPPGEPRRPGLPPALDEVLAQALAKRPADRFDSCTEFATAAMRALTSNDATVIAPGRTAAPASTVGDTAPATLIGLPPGAPTSPTPPPPPDAQPPSPETTRRSDIASPRADTPTPMHEPRPPHSQPEARGPDTASPHSESAPRQHNTAPPPRSDNPTPRSDAPSQPAGTALSHSASASRRDEGEANNPTRRSDTPSQPAGTALPHSAYTPRRDEGEANNLTWRSDTPSQLADTAPSRVVPTPSSSAAAQHFGDRPPQPREPTPHARRPIGRRATVVALGLVVLLAVVAGIVWVVRDSSKSSDSAGTSGGTSLPEGMVAVIPNFYPLGQINAEGAQLAPSSPTADPAGDGSATCQPLSIAMTGPLSGADGALGGAVLGGVRLAVAQFTQKNPQCQVYVQDFDTTGSPQEAARLAPQITDDTSTIALIGPALSTEAKAAGQSYSAAGLPFLTPSATESTLSASGWSTFFRGTAPESFQGPAVGRHLATQYGRVCVISDDTAYGIELGRGVTSGLSGAGLRECAQTLGTGSDPTSTVDHIAAIAPDAIFYAGVYNESAPLLKRLREVGVTAAFVSGDRSFDPQFLTAAESAASGAIVSCLCAPGTDRLLSEYEAANGEAAGVYSIEAYDLTTIVLRGIASGHVTREGLLNYLRGYDGVGVGHAYRWTDQGELAEPRIWGYQAY